MLKKLALMATIASMAALPLAASAGSQSTPLQVTATVVNDCSITVPSPFNVTSNYDFLNAADATNTENGSVSCTVGSSPSISLGSAGGPNSIALALSDGTDTLNSTLSAGGISSGSFTLTDDIASGQNVEAGNYAGSTTVYVNF